MKDSQKPIPVSVLSGFLGAGKTTTLKHVLENKEGLKVAVIVNDMAEVNVDANLIKEQGALVHAEEKMVELSNGCICCTLREDLLVELGKLAAAGGLDHILIESSSISEPLPVAETFTFKDPKGTSLSDIARLDTLVTVVDGASFMHELEAAEELKDRGWELSAADKRTTAQLFLDQIEFANVIVMNKCDLLEAAEKSKLRTLLKNLNSGARLVEATRGRVDPKTILGTGLFSLSQAEQHPEWLKEARIGEHTAETEEYGISSIVFKSHRPLSPKKLNAALNGLTRNGLIGENLPKISRTTGTNVVRAKGVVWLASERSHWMRGEASLAGRRLAIQLVAPWGAALREAHPADAGHHAAKPVPAALKAIWHEPFGDRRTELVVIGQDMDKAAVEAALRESELTDAEIDTYKQRAATALAKIQGKSGQAVACDAETVSAHSAIATFAGVSNWAAGGVAKFSIVRYLKYAHLADAPELKINGDEISTTFELPLALSAAPLGVVAETDWQGLNDVVAGFSVGKKIEMEFLQLRVDVDGHKITISHLLKITELTEALEAKLIKEFPAPEVMTLKLGTHLVKLEVAKKSKKRDAPEPSHPHAHAAQA